jgi:hypothetical protein
VYWERLFESASSTLLDGRALIIGGRLYANGTWGYTLGTWDVYVNGAVITSTSTVFVCYRQAVRRADGSVVCLGSNEAGTRGAQMRDAVSGAWRLVATSSIADALEGYCLLPLEDGGVLVVGGLNRTFGAYANGVYGSDVGLSTWTTRGALPYALARMGCARTSDGVLLVAGGENDLGLLAGVLASLDEGRSWCTLSSPRTVFNYPGIAIARGQVVVVGSGYDTPLVATESTFAAAAADAGCRRSQRM